MRGGGVSHLRHDLDQCDRIDVVIERGAGGDARRRADEGDPLRPAVQQERHVALARLVHQLPRAPERIVPVEAEQTFAGSLDHRDGPGGAAVLLEHALAGHAARERQRQGIGAHQDQQRAAQYDAGPEPTAQTPRVRRDGRRGQRDRRERRRRADHQEPSPGSERRQNDEWRDDASDDGAHGVGHRKDADPIPGRPSTLVVASRHRRRPRARAWRARCTRRRRVPDPPNEDDRQHHERIRDRVGRADVLEPAGHPVETGGHEGEPDRGRGARPSGDRAGTDETPCA